MDHGLSRPLNAYREAKASLFSIFNFILLFVVLCFRSMNSGVIRQTGKVPDPGHRQKKLSAGSAVREHADIFPSNPRQREHADMIGSNPSHNSLSHDSIESWGDEAGSSPEPVIEVMDSDMQIEADDDLTTEQAKHLVMDSDTQRQADDDLTTDQAKHMAKDSDMQRQADGDLTTDQAKHMAKDSDTQRQADGDLTTEQAKPIDPRPNKKHKQTSLPFNGRVYKRPAAKSTSEHSMHAIFDTPMSEWDKGHSETCFQNHPPPPKTLVEAIRERMIEYRRVKMR